MIQIEALIPDLKVITTQLGSNLTKLEVFAHNSIVISSASNGAPLKQVNLNFRIKDFYNFATVALAKEITAKGVILTNPVIFENHDSLNLTLANVSTEPFSLDKGKLLATLFIS